jgi:hypothetical protein
LVSSRRRGILRREASKFYGETIDSLREAVKTKSELTHPAGGLKLVAAGSDESEIDLDGMQDLEDEDGVFNFKQLVARYKIKQRNPIVVKLPCKRHSFI